jgi:hypothetical protein
MPTPERTLGTVSAPSRAADAGAAAVRTCRRQRALRQMSVFSRRGSGRTGRLPKDLQASAQLIAVNRRSPAYVCGMWDGHSVLVRASRTPMATAATMRLRKPSPTRTRPPVLATSEPALERFIRSKPPHTNAMRPRTLNPRAGEGLLRDACDWISVMHEVCVARRTPCRRLWSTSEFTLLGTVELHPGSDGSGTQPRQI